NRCQDNEPVPQGGKCSCRLGQCAAQKCQLQQSIAHPEGTPGSVHGCGDSVASLECPHSGAELRESAEHGSEWREIEIGARPAKPMRHVGRNHERCAGKAIYPQYGWSRERLQVNLCWNRLSRFISRKGNYGTCHTTSSSALVDSRF